MIAGIQLKICGLTSAPDARAAADIGADYLGFIFYEPSPRTTSRAGYLGFREALPRHARRVAVTVKPTPVELAELAGLGFDLFQVHCDLATPIETIAAWAETVGVSRLWLAPKLPPVEDVPANWVPLAAAVLLDTFHAEKYGGTGQTGDWPKFQRHRERHRERDWILSGGLNPTNIAAAIAATGATIVDVNSGVEAAPGVKDSAKLEALAAALGAR